MRAIRPIRAFAPVVLLAGWLIAAPAAFAHEHVKVGQYELGIGWAVEPTYVGVLNAVEVSVEGPDGEPVTDLPDLALRVTVSTADQSTEALELVQAFDTPGRYLAALLPTAPGEYTFHIVGDIHQQAVDVTMTSGDTFSSVQAPTDVEFPFKVPTQADVAEHLDRIDARIEDLQASAISPDALGDLQASVADAGSAADRASTMGLLVGGSGLLVAIVALVVAWRATRKGAGSA